MNTYQEDLGFDRVENDGRVQFRCLTCVVVVIDGHPAHASQCPKSVGGRLAGAQ